MPDVFFDNPPILQGDERTQLQQLNNYLFTVSNKLNEAMMEVSIQEKTLTQSPAASGLSETDKKEQQAAYNSLKSMIVKTAEIVRTEMTEISTHLEKEVEAISSQYGTLEENLESDIRATAEGILQEYHYEERVTGLESETEGFIKRTNQYIFSGLVDPVNLLYGIAIGEGVTAYDNDGNPYLNDNAKCATFTMEEMAFWQGEVKLAYFSDHEMHINEAVIDKSMRIGNFIWQSTADNSLALISAG